MPLFSGTLSALVAPARRLPIFARAPCGVKRRASMAIVPTAGWLLVVELSNLAMYAFSRVILGAYRSPAAVGLFEGPVRAHNLLYALGGALAVPVVPTASRYVATGDERRLRELARARHALHARAVRAALRDADGARRADPRASGSATATARRRGAGDPRLLLAALRRARGHAGLPRRRRAGARGGAHHGRGGARPTSCCRSCSRRSWASRGRRSRPRCRSSSPSRSCCGSA